jgi:ribonuclease J
VLVILVADVRRRKVLGTPQIITRGFVYVRESSLILEEAGYVVQRTVDNLIQTESSSWSHWKQKILKELAAFLFRRTKRLPMILPILSNPSFRS